MTTPTFDRLLGLVSDDQRTFKDDRGTRWMVYERTARTLTNPARLFLIFESMSAVRRVSVFPLDWRGLDGLALERLSWAR